MHSLRFGCRRHLRHMCWTDRIPYLVDREKRASANEMRTREKQKLN